MSHLKIMKEYGMITIGTFIIAVAVFFFMIPSNVIVGSLSGLGVVLTNVIPLPISAITLLFNVVLLAIGFVVLGKEFGAKTIYACMIYPIFLYWLEKTLPANDSLTKDILLDTICYLLVVSVGQAILFRINASSGGIDIIAKILNKFTHIEMGKAMAISGMAIAVSSVFVYDKKVVILSILGTYANGIVLDNYINGFKRRKRVCIMSKEHKTLQRFIVDKLHRGVTLYQALGGYNGETRMEIVTILTRSEYAMLMEYLQTVDDAAFVTVSTVNEVIGNWRKKS